MGRRRNQRREEMERGVCPLFLHHTELDISCETHVADAKWTTIHYERPELRRFQQKTYCESLNYKRCEHYLSWLHFQWEDE